MEEMLTIIAKNCCFLVHLSLNFHMDSYEKHQIRKPIGYERCKEIVKQIFSHGQTDSDSKSSIASHRCRLTNIEIAFGDKWPVDRIVRADTYGRRKYLITRPDIADLVVIPMDINQMRKELKEEPDLKSRFHRYDIVGFAQAAETGLLRKPVHTPQQRIM